MTNLFNNVSEKNKEKIYKFLKAYTVSYTKDVNVLSNVNRTNFIGIIESGSADLIISDYYGDNTLLDELEKDSIFGSLISSVSSEEIACITKEDTKITFIDYERIVDSENIKNDYYLTFIKNLLKILQEQLNSRNERIEILTKKTTRDKILQYFKILSNKKNSSSFTLPCTFTELANFLSVDRSAMTRELKYLKSEGFIIINKKRITLTYQ